jgi:hypothetical protein
MGNQDAARGQTPSASIAQRYRGGQRPMILYRAEGRRSADIYLTCNDYAEPIQRFPHREDSAGQRQGPEQG